VELGGGQERIGFGRRMGRSGIGGEGGEEQSWEEEEEEEECLGGEEEWGGGESGVDERERGIAKWRGC